MFRKTLIAFIAAVSLAALAAPTMDEPSVSERIVSAHKAIQSKSWRTAMFELEQALREEPRNPEVHSLLGYVYRVRSNPDLAKSFEHYNTALKYNPQHKGTLEYIGEAYLMDKKPAEAEQMLARLETVCGKACPEYVELSTAIAQYKAKN